MIIFEYHSRTYLNLSVQELNNILDELNELSKKTGGIISMWSYLGIFGIEIFDWMKTYQIDMRTFRLKTKDNIVMIVD